MIETTGDHADLFLIALKEFAFGQEIANHYACIAMLAVDCVVHSPHVVIGNLTG
jgi:hypothetical protein